MAELINGKPISEKLSEFLRKFTSPKDMADVSTETNVSISTIRDVRLRRNNISEENKKAIIKLMKKADQNADFKIKEAKEGKRQVKQILDCI
ncbi:hypothetical protein ATE47_03950 [Chryseobacterium sp. IHB B 17019]|uniref:hypothetical protein n=1 Tax=Chryseobacterium sp. IHB B 17019 TaxID=1721091 RepID=UPI0007220740|nr:hypothetical protein [Chryseobacterium sp. IHB B 17019]ALR29724.1 hypothetical protein ATE47_03950 [Chryseobacterium sp. IHB B 17019]